MPSFEQQITNNRIIIAVRVSRQGEDVPYRRALVDTGATITAISPNVVSELGLSPIGLASTTVASGQQVDTYQYYSRVDIPIGHYIDQAPPTDFLMGRQLTVVGLPYQPNDYDVILGMDIIGMFHITMYRNKIIISN
ncbi:MAG: retroviral-like aspartic protease [Chloroflexi bacterium]|nr:retroviral-like aspartic protease [Chloroflexota bacterium]